MNRKKTFSILLLLIVTLIIIKVVFNCFYTKKEGFDNSVESIYKQFVQFYNPFIQQWEQAIQTTIATNTVQQPLTSPSQVSQINQNQLQSQQLNISDINSEIQQLSSNEGQIFPQIQTFSFPESYPNKDSDALLQIAEKLPTDSQPYINALNWMNSKLDKSHGNLKKALQGNYTPSSEGFISEQCSAQQKEMENCYNEMQQERMQKAEATIQNKLQSFNPNQQDLQQAWQKNQELVNKSKDIQNQAQSGELLKQVNVKDSHYYAPYQMPDGANNLKNIQQNNPERYAELQKNYSQWASIKSLTDQINGTLG